MKIMIYMHKGNDEFNLNLWEINPVLCFHMQSLLTHFTIYYQWMFASFGLILPNLCLILPSLPHSSLFSKQLEAPFILPKCHFICSDSLAITIHKLVSKTSCLLQMRVHLNSALYFLLFCHLLFSQIVALTPHNELDPMRFKPISSN